MPDPRGTDTRLTGHGDGTTAHRPTPAERGLAAAGGGPRAGAGKPGTADKRLTAPALLYYESAPKDAKKPEREQAAKNRIIAETYARQVLRVTGPLAGVVHGVASWKDLQADLARYSSVGRLVFTLHGSEGAMMVGNEMKGLDKVGADLARKGLRADRVDFEACNVAGGPEALVQFGRSLGARTLTAWNMFWITRVLDVPVGPPPDPNLAARMAPHRPWLLPGSPSDGEMSKRKGRWQLVQEWFREDFSEDGLPGPPARGELDARPRTFRPRSSAILQTIRPEDAKRFQQEMAKPVLPLIHLTIDLTPAAPAAAPEKAQPAVQGADRGR